jgi:hypothetical protein
MSEVPNMVSKRLQPKRTKPAVTLQASVTVKEASLVKFQDILGLRKARWLQKLVTALDNKLLGLVPAVIEPALLRWRTSAEAERLTKLSNAATDAETYRAVEIAKARTQVIKSDATAIKVVMPTAKRSVPWMRKTNAKLLCMNTILCERRYCIARIG